MEKLSLLDAGDICRAIDANSEEMLQIQTKVAVFEGKLQQPEYSSQKELFIARKKIQELKNKYNTINKRVWNYADRLKTLPVYISDSMISDIANRVAQNEKGEDLFRYGGIEVLVTYAIHADGYREDDTNAYIVTDVYGNVEIQVSNGDCEIDCYPNADKVVSEISKQVKNILKQ